jgi:hypothetical protein
MHVMSESVCFLRLQPFAEAPTAEALRAFLNLDLALECDGEIPATLSVMLL